MLIIANTNNAFCLGSADGYTYTAHTQHRSAQGHGPRPLTADKNLHALAPAPTLAHNVSD